MEDLIFFLAAFFFIMVFICFSLMKQSNSCTFPGPKPLPIVGNVFSMDFTALHMTFAQLAEQYGKLVKVSFFGRQVVVINDINLARKAFLGEVYGDVFNDRPIHFTGKYILFNANSIGQGKAIKRTFILRKMLHKGFKVFGEGQARFEHHVTEELDRLVSEIDDNEGKDFNMCLLLKKSFANWMASLVTGKKANIDDSQIIWYYIESGNLLAAPGLNELMVLFPFLRHLPGKPGRTYEAVLKARYKLLQRFVYLHKEDAVSALKNADGLLAALIKMQKEENERAGYEIIDDLRGSMIDIFYAGVETTTTALINAFALLLRCPECSRKLRFEIDSVIGSSRAPSLDDRSNMPYTKAFLLELHRFTTDVPLALPHMSMRDVIFEGYNIKKHSVVLLNTWFIHHDKKLWGDPWHFRPERFLDASGQLLPPDHELRQAWVPFSVGRRACPGETLAMTRTFLYLTRILQAFEI